MKSSDLRIVLSRLNTVNLETSLVCRIFREYGLSLEILGIDIFNIFRNSEASVIYKQALLIDLIEMAKLCAFDESEEEIREEFSVMLKEVEDKMSWIDTSNVRLVNVTFEDIDTLVFAYRSP